ncbi:MULTISPECIES: DUF1697 domain-containing protein [Streptomyces]|uniref:DUF1697 domain-containing protein n=1 Tax=Streptomyces luteosporeus TaxID=173856 RepID=A0ABN3TL42_9ACTN
MATKAYAALLRGINVGGRKKVPMAELRSLLEQLGHGDVRTYLQSGNAVFTSPQPDEGVLAAQLREALAARFGFPVDVIVRDHAYLAAVAAACPFPAAELEGRQLHVTYFAEPIPPPAVERSGFLPEDFALGDRALYLYAPDGLGRSPLGDTLARAVARTGAVATSRNWNTVLRLTEMTKPGG